MIPKYRAWIIAEKRMVEVMGIDFGNDCIDYLKPKSMIYSGVDFKDIILMQWTGLQDKNGVDVYEGDRVEGLFPWGCISGFMVFDCGCFRIKFDDDASVLTALDTDFYCIEVIGNIHQNPELKES